MSNSFIKIFIFPKITPWGVVRKSDGTLEYKHVLRFETDDLRDEFINENLYEEIGDYRQDLENSPARRVDFMSDTRIHFRYEASENFNKIRTSDFCAVEIDGEIQFYALKVLKTEAKVIFFEGEIDLFFTYKIQFKDNSQNSILRAHSNRLTSDGTAFKFPHPETFEDMWLDHEPFSKELLQTTPIVENTVLSNSLSFPAGTRWVIVIAKFNRNTDNPAFDFWYRLNGFSINETYGVMFFPFHSNYIFNIFDSDDQRAYRVGIDLSKIRRLEAVLKICITENPPVPFLKTDWRSEITGNNFTIGYKSGEIPLDSGIGTIKKFRLDGDDETFVASNFLLVNVNGKNKILKRIFNLGETIENYRNNGLFDPKLFHNQFFQVGLSKWNIEPRFYSLRNLSVSYGKIELNSFSSVEVSKTDTDYWFKKLGLEGNNFYEGNILNVVTTSEFPLLNDLWRNYYNQNRNSIFARKQQARVSLGLGLLQGAVGVATGVATGGVGAVVGATAGGFGAAQGIKSYAFEMQNLEAQKKDLQQRPQPNRVEGNDFIDELMFDDEIFSQRNLQILGYSPTDLHLQLINDFFNKFGYSFGQKIQNANPLLSNRKYWNFLQLIDGFNTLNIRVSSPQKQIIGNSLENGITFWHYRNRQDWQGVLSYGRQNWETNHNFSQSNRAKKLSAPKKSKTSKTTTAPKNFDENR